MAVRRIEDQILLWFDDSFFFAQKIGNVHKTIYAQGNNRLFVT